MAFAHHVCFWLNNPESANDKEALISGLKKLTSIETLTYSQVGIPASTDRPVIERSYHVSWLCVFENIEGHDLYQDHPLHLDFVKECSHLWEKVRIYDTVDA